MLSRVAHSIYWMARYVERAENTARIVNVNANLLLDLPRQLKLGWLPLIEITGSSDLFFSLYDEASENNVVRFLIADTRNPSSMLSALHQGRENACTVRENIPAEAWEHLNELYLFVKNGLPANLVRKRRYDFLIDTIGGVQQLTGLLAGTMLHNEGYWFLRMGRNLERADMTTRIVDTRSESLLPVSADELVPFEDIQWMSVLMSLSAYQAYRKSTQSPVQRMTVLSFLLQEREFPRSFYHCLGEVQDCLKKLTRGDPALAYVSQLNRKIRTARIHRYDNERMHTFIDDLQLRLGKLDNMISGIYWYPG